MCLAIMALTDPAICICREALTNAEVLPPTLASNSQPPNLLDGTTRLYISYICPYVQRVWIARNFKVPTHPADHIWDTHHLLIYATLYYCCSSFPMPCRAVFRAGRAGGDEISELVAPALDKVEEALGRFSDGPFFLGQSRSAVDMVYAPFVERFKDFFAAVKQYDMTRGRPWIQELNKIDAYAATWGDRRLQIAAMMIKFGVT
ncbi:protein IN2-1 homolog A-like [Panicum hallii]|uniref:protein IN2-1 homolog A-like n=1 Tax=Panicum hallii TaxID=206008 RepID=UPI000DF4E4EB|nr:protein IN2-1 homolog A-like [Panicum hallii]